MLVEICVNHTPSCMHSRTSPFLHAYAHSMMLKCQHNMRTPARTLTYGHPETQLHRRIPTEKHTQTYMFGVYVHIFKLTLPGLAYRTLGPLWTLHATCKYSFATVSSQYFRTYHSVFFPPKATKGRVIIPAHHHHPCLFIWLAFCACYMCACPRYIHVVFASTRAAEWRCSVIYTYIYIYLHYMSIICICIFIFMYIYLYLCIYIYMLCQ